MNCKNCNTDLAEKTKFCKKCGAKVVTYRISLKSLYGDISSQVLGWDNKYFFTIKSLIKHPEVILQGYIDGVRKKYVNPFTFFAIGTAISLLVFNYYSKEYLNLSGNINDTQNELLMDQSSENDPSEEQIDLSDADRKKIVKEEQQRRLQKRIIELQDSIQKGILQYFNLFSFALLPFYAFIAFLVYRKPYNYGEHIIINAYIQGVSFLVTVLIFLISIFINPSLYFLSVLFTMFMYVYAYSRLYKLSFKKATLKFFKFIAILLGVIILFAIITFAIGIVIAILTKL